MNSETFCDVLHKRINRARTNIALVHAELSRNPCISEIAFGSLCYLQDCINQLETECDDVCNALSRAIKLAERLAAPIAKSEPRRTTRIVPNPVDEMMDGSANFESMPPDHPYFRDTPLVYIQGGPATCIACKETHPCGCDGYLMSDRPDTPVERAPFQSPPPDAQAIPEESPLVMTQSDYDRYQQEIASPPMSTDTRPYYRCRDGTKKYAEDYIFEPPSNVCSENERDCSPDCSDSPSVIAESKEHLYGPDDQSRSAAPSPESLVSDSMKALLDDCVMKK